MRMILTAFPQKAAGIVLLKAGVLANKFRDKERLLITSVPKEFNNLPSGELPSLKQSLANDMQLRPFFSDPEVLRRAGYGVEAWVSRIDHCQWKHKLHDKNLITVSNPRGYVRLCWSCDNLHREQFHPALGDIAETNQTEFIIDYVCSDLGFAEGHQLTLPELCWWAALHDVADKLPHYIMSRITKIPDTSIAGVMKESEIDPWKPEPKQVVADAVERVKPVVKLAIDEEPPTGFMLRPKLTRWESTKYTKWVKKQKCCGCGCQADDPHHIINSGLNLGGIGTKAHDLFVIPLCRVCHDKLHGDVAAWETENGSQLEHLVKTLNFALGVGAILKA